MLKCTRVTERVLDYQLFSSSSRSARWLYTYRTAAEISDPLASRDLRGLVDAGLLVPRGERRGRHYVANEWPRQARDSTRAVTVTTYPFTDEIVRVEPVVG